ncbi:MAG: PD-(D/E)XK nuclease family protein, partial [Myxococcaceae bacterium]|nr:PD-(D/E)XK nuclease family protein [Myxococcaceae bacterium]
GQGSVGAHRLSRAEFARWLEDAAGDVNLPPSGPRAGAVRVLDARAVPGRQFAHVLVGGLVEGRFPARTPALPLLAPGDGEALNAAAKRRLVRLVAGEATQALPARLAEDRFLFFGALSAATQGVVLAWARSDDEGREQVQSTLLDETLRLLEPGATLRAPRAASPPLEAAASLDELRPRLALEYLSAPRTRLSRRAAGAEVPSEALEALPWFADARRVAAMELERLEYFAHPEALPGPYSGRLREPRTEQKLSALLTFDARHPLSAAVLESFATCAFQGLGRSMLRLEERESPGEALDARSSGSFSHAVLERLIPALAEQGWPRAPVDLEPAIEAAVAEVAADFERANFTGHPLLWPLEQTKARTMARRVLTQGDEAQPFAEQGLQFSRGEVAFGRDASGPWAAVPLPGAFPGEETVHFTGRIDRVDQGPAGLGVIDYKAKRAAGLPGRNELFSPAFQLPVYLHAARQALGVPAVVAAGLALRDAVAKPLSRLLDVPVSQLLAVDAEGRTRAGEVNLANAVHALLGRLRAGDFGARSLDCEYCRFAQVCRIREQALDDWRPK